MDVCTWRGRGRSKSFISRVIIEIVVTPYRVLITLLITYLLSPAPPSMYVCIYVMISETRFASFVSSPQSLCSWDLLGFDRLGLVNS